MSAEVELLESMTSTSLPPGRHDAAQQFLPLVLGEAAARCFRSCLRNCHAVEVLLDQALVLGLADAAFDIVLFHQLVERVRLAQHG